MKKILPLFAFLSFAFCAHAQSPLNALHFDGTDDYVSAPLPPIFNNIGANDFTVEAWVNREAMGRIFYAQVDGSNFATILLSGPNLLFYVKVSNITYTSSIIIIPANQWVHVAATWDASAQLPLLYVDGVLQAGTSGGASSFGTNNTMTIGSRTDGQQPFQGMIDEVRIWNTTRTECEIRSMMNSEPDGTETDLISYYDFNRGTPAGNNVSFTTLPDLVGINNGSLNNFTLNGVTSNWILSGASINAVGLQPSFQTDITDTICGGTYVLGSQTLSVSGVYNEMFTSAQGCDSLVVLTLVVGANDTTVINISTCHQYVFNGDTLTSGGTYYDTLSTSPGCDSIIELHLTLGQPVNEYISDTACESFLFNGNLLTVSGNYSDTLTTAYGCDSIISLDLLIAPLTVTIVTETACNSFLFDGNILTESGIYPDTLASVNGCDSIILLNLTIHSADASVYQSGEILVAATDQDSYQWLDCQNGTPIAGETGFVLMPSENGNYAVEISHDGCVDTSECVEIQTLLVEGFTEAEFLVYPNPTSGLIHISTVSGMEISRVELADINGRILKVQSMPADLDLTVFPSGNYIIFIYSGDQRWAKRVIRS